MRNAFMQTDLMPADSVSSSTLAEFAHDFFHLPEYQQIAADLEGGKAFYFMAREGGASLLIPIAVRPIDETLEAEWPGCRDATSAYGHSGPLLRNAGPGFVEGACRTFLEALRGQRIVSCFLRMHPLFEFPVEVMQKVGKSVSHGATVSVDLRVTDAERWQQMRRSHRRNIRKAEAAGYHAVEDVEWREISRFASIYESSMRRRNAHDFYRFSQHYFDELRRRLGGRIHLWLVRKDEQIAAASLYTEWGGIVTAFLGGAHDAHIADGPLKVADSQVCAWAKQRGNHTVHLGGGVGGAEDSLFQYKAGFSPHRHPFRTWHLIVDPPKYEALTALSRRLSPSSEPSDFFPAYRQPRARAVPALPWACESTQSLLVQP
jgi:hypothetical protein